MSPTIIVDMSISHFCPNSFYFTYVEALVCGVENDLEAQEQI